MTAGQELPETLPQAVEYDRRRDAYAYRAGLCDPCSAAVSWGHALGFTRVSRLPCEGCAPIVATFPEPTSHPAWRKWPRGRVGGPLTRPSRSRGLLACPEPWTGLSAVQEVGP